MIAIYSLSILGMIHTHTSERARQPLRLPLAKTTHTRTRNMEKKRFQSQTRFSQGDYQASHLKPCPIGSVRSRRTRRTCECGRSVTEYGQVYDVFSRNIRACIGRAANPFVTYTMDTKGSQSAPKIQRIGALDSAPGRLTVDMMSAQNKCWPITNSFRCGQC